MESKENHQHAIKVKVTRKKEEDPKEAMENRREAEKSQEVQSDVAIEVLVVAEIQVLVLTETEVETKVLVKVETKVLVKVETKVPDERIEVLARKGVLEGVGTGAPVVGTVAPEEVETEVLGEVGREVGREVLGEGTEVQEEVEIGAPVVVQKGVGTRVPVVAPEEVGIEVLAVVQREEVEAPEDRVLEKASHRIVFGTDETVDGAEMMKERKYI